MGPGPAMAISLKSTYHPCKPEGVLRVEFRVYRGLEGFIGVYGVYRDKIPDPETHKMGGGSTEESPVKSPAAQNGTRQIDKASAAAGATPAEVYGVPFGRCLRQLYFGAACMLFLLARLSS